MNPLGSRYKTLVWAELMFRATRGRSLGSSKQVWELLKGLTTNHEEILLAFVKLIWAASRRFPGLYLLVAALFGASQ